MYSKDQQTKKAREIGTRLNKGETMTREQINSELNIYK